MTSLTNLVRYALLSTAALALGGCGGGGSAGDQTASTISPTSHSINAVPALQADTAAGSNAPAGSQSNVASNIVTLPGPRANYTWTASSTGVVVQNLSAGATSTLSTSVARLIFSDGATAFDISGVAGQAYRLYQAALDRAPDQGGLGYQIAAIEGSGLSLTQVSQNFIASAEFASKYGNVSNSQFITQLYQNVLHRAPDAAGLQYYLTAITSGQASKAQILINFSESPENMANVLPSIQNGMGYVPYPTLAASQGFPAAALQIATQPQSVNVLLNGNATLSVVARGNSALTYQWYLRGTALFGATGPAYAITAAAASDAADYHVVVTNSSGNSIVSNSAAVGVVGLASDTSGSMASGRVMVGTINGRTARLPPANTSWQLAYKYRVPPLPGGSWNPNQQTFYIWGDVDFDPYGPRSPQWSISEYKYNQIVPQLFIGNVLSQNDARYTPGWTIQTQWAIQAQYFWQKDNTPFAQTGSIVYVKPGDVIATTIAYDAPTGKITATISSVEGSSTIVMDRPFPNDPTLFQSWASFFAQAQAASGTAFVWADPELNVEPTADRQTVCTVLPFTIDLIDVPGFGPNSSKYSQTDLSKFSCAKPLALFNF